MSPSVIAAVMVAFHIVGVMAALHAVMTVRARRRRHCVGGVAGDDAVLRADSVPDLRPQHLRRLCQCPPFHNDRLREIRRGMTASEREAMSACVVTAPAQACMRALPGLTGMPCLANNDVRLLINGQQTFEAIFAAIDAATQVVLVQFFIVHDDELGRDLQRRLCEKARAGVKVYFLFDSIGCHGLGRGYVRTLQQAGVEARPSPPIPALSIVSS